MEIYRNFDHKILGIWDLYIEKEAFTERGETKKD